ncbi:MAG TPA: hypothetical protein VGB26_10205 [Nitrospiria bacterium]|jgi:hypothetical protein
MKSEKLEKVVVHYQDNKILKGYIQPFQLPNAEASFSREEKNPTEILKIPLKELKAIYYVKSHEGNKTYREKRRFGLTSSKGKKVMIKFKDREIACGFVTDNLPWILGKNQPDPDPARFGFFLFPADPESNNTKIFVLTRAVEEIQEF